MTFGKELPQAKMAQDSECVARREPSEIQRVDDECFEEMQDENLLPNAVIAMLHDIVERKTKTFRNRNNQQSKSL